MWDRIISAPKTTIPIPCLHGDNKNQKQQKTRSTRCIERISLSIPLTLSFRPLGTPGKSLPCKTKEKRIPRRIVNRVSRLSPSRRHHHHHQPHSTSDKTLSLTHTHTLSLSPSLALEPKPKPINAQFLPPAVTNCKQKLEVRFLHNGVGEAAAMAGFGMLCFAMLCFSVARVGRASKPVVQAEGNTKAKEPPSPALPTSCLQTYGAYLIRMYYISRVRWTTGRFLVPR